MTPGSAVQSTQALAWGAKIRRNLEWSFLLIVILLLFFWLVKSPLVSKSSHSVIHSPFSHGEKPPVLFSRNSRVVLLKTCSFSVSVNKYDYPTLHTTSLRSQTHCLMLMISQTPAPPLTFSPPLSLPRLNTSLDSGRKREWTNGEIGIDIYSLPRVKSTAGEKLVCNTGTLRPAVVWGMGWGTGGDICIFMAEYGFPGGSW